MWEVKNDPSETFEFGGLKFGSFRGIPYIAGEWSDEQSRAEQDDLCRRLPDDIDVLLTHCPAIGILDNSGDDSHYGSRAIASYLNRRQYTQKKLKAHLFGHVHESFGKREFGGTIFSNAATGVNLVEIS